MGMSASFPQHRASIAWLVVAAGVASGCTDVGYGSAAGTGGSGAGGEAATSSAATAGATSTTSTTSPGGCMSDTQCDDGNPCSEDTCTNGKCESFPVAEGKPGVGEGCPDGALCQSDGACGLSVWQHTIGNESSAWYRAPLSSAWSGSNAPPPRGITAVDLTLGDRLLFVFADTGLVYRRLDDVWLTPKSAAELFQRPNTPEGAAAPELDPSKPSALTTWRSQAGGKHSLWVRQGAPDGSQLIYVFDFLVDNPDAIATVGPYYGVTIPADPRPGAPPVHSTTPGWQLAYQIAYEGTPGWLKEIYEYGGRFYQYDSAGESWASWDTLEQTVVWPKSAACPCPAPSKIVAAYVRQQSMVTFIAP